MAPKDKDFLIVEGTIKSIRDEEVELVLNDKLIQLPSEFVPKSVKEGDKIKLAVATVLAYEKKLELNAKKVLNEILGNG